MDDLLSLKEAIIVYLDNSGGLRKLVKDCEALKGAPTTEAVYRFGFQVNPSDVLELDAVLGDCLLHDPLKALALFQSVCFLSIKTLGLLEHIETENQINVVLKPTHLPPLPNYCLELSTFPRVYGPMRLSALEGLVIAMTPVSKYTQGARFLCSEETCPCSQGFHHIRVHAPGATESATVRSDFICFLCSSPLKEAVKSRVLGDKQIVELIHSNALSAMGVPDIISLRYQTITLFLRDELCNSMKIGHRYRVVGIPAHVHQGPNVTWSVEACSVQPLIPEWPRLVSHNFQNLLAASACSPWRFTAIIANSFGSSIIPPGLYNTLKLALLLSLVQTEDSQEMLNHLDVLALTSDTLIIDRLMKYCLTLAPCGILHQLTGELLASLSRDEHGTGSANIQAGSALLASGGVCLLGDLTSYKKDKLDMLQSALETRSVSVFIPGKKFDGDTDQHLSLPIQCNFWALADPNLPSKKSTRCDDVILGRADTGSVPPQLAEAFGLLVHCRETSNNFQSMTVHILRKGMSPDEPLYPACTQFTTQDYKELLAYARALKLERSPGAERMIHGYYMGSRRVRSKVSATSMKMLMSLAQAHAKLSLRTKVLEEDAVVAVLLCESSVTLKHGASVLTFPPEALFPCAIHNQDSLHSRDLALHEFHKKTWDFVHGYAATTIEE